MFELTLAITTVPKQILYYRIENRLIAVRVIIREKIFQSECLQTLKKILY